MPIGFYAEFELSVKEYADRAERPVELAFVVRGVRVVHIRQAVVRVRVVVPRARKHNGVARVVIDAALVHRYSLYIQFIKPLMFSREGSPEPPLRIF